MLYLAAGELLLVSQNLVSEQCQRQKAKLHEKREGGVGGEGKRCGEVELREVSLRLVR